MKTIVIPLVAVAAVLPAIASTPKPSVETITYRAGACLGTCPIYTFTVSSDGQGAYKGTNFVTTIGDRSFHATSAQFEAFRARLAPYRPNRDSETLVHPGSNLCPESGTDSPEIEVTWMLDGHPAGHVRYYYGCIRPKVPSDMLPALASAPDLLPISEFIGPKRRR